MCENKQVKSKLDDSECEWKDEWPDRMKLAIYHMSNIIADLKNISASSVFETSMNYIINETDWLLEDNKLDRTKKDLSLMFENYRLNDRVQELEEHIETLESK